MKHFPLFTKLVIAGMTILLFSCSSGGSKAKEASADTSQTKVADAQSEKTTEVAAAKPMNIVIVKHKVANFAKWKLGYDGHDSARRAAGLTNYIIARGLNKDSNMVVVVMKTDDIIKAKEFASSNDLKETMEKAGVIGTPNVMYDELVWDDNSKIDQTTRLMISHKVKDFNIWKKEFDNTKQDRMDAGLVDRGVAHTSGDSGDVTVVFAVNDMAKAKAFINSKDLKDKMAAAGVDGQPTFFFYKIVKMY